MSKESVANVKYVYLFTELEQAEDYVGGNWDAVRGLLGGKGANLADMTRLGVPVPPGFTVTTEACNAYLAAGEEFPGDMWEQVLEAVKGVEKQVGESIRRSRTSRCWYPAAPAPSSPCPA